MKLFNFLTRWFKPKSTPNVDDALLERMLRAVAVTSIDELGCDDTNALLDEFAELVARGEDAEGLMPLVKNHLDLCGACHEEYEVLEQILEAAK